MDLIHFQGLNCYHDCVISIANHLGINYSDAFSTLWSETEFRFDSYCEAYLSKRIITNLEMLGFVVKSYACHSPEGAEKNLSQFYKGDFAIVGMDAFYIPWNQFYKSFHGHHYFIIQNTGSKTLNCFDPTYNIKDKQMEFDEIIAHTFDVCRINKSEISQIEIGDEAENILKTHQNTRKMLITQLNKNNEQKDIILFAKYIDTMICNRYLYQFYLKKHKLFLSVDNFLEWQAVKNGLYKAAVSSDKESIFNNIHNHINNLIDVETAIAKRRFN